jgi:hypothetical protein
MFKCFLAAVLLCVSAAVTKAEEYVIFFTATGPKNEVELYHTYATFLKKDKQGRLESRTISWLPKSRKIQPNAVRTEEGVNLDVTETTRWAREKKCEVKRYGPFKVDDGLFDLADAQVQRLESGVVKYRYKDGNVRKQVTNGYNAVADVYVPKLVGAEDRPTDLVTHFRSWYLAGGGGHEWLLKELQIEHIKQAK